MKPILFLTLLVGVSFAQANSFNALNSYEFGTTTESWTPIQTSFTVSNGIASGTATGGDPQIARRPSPNFPGNASSGVLIRYRGNTNGNTQIFWGRTGGDTYAAGRSVTVNYTGSGQWQTLYFNPKGNADWDDRTITRLRFDPAGGTGSTFEIDWIRVLSWDYNNDGSPDHIQGTGDTNGDGILDIEEVDANGDSVPDGWARFIANAPGSTHFNFNETGNFEGWTTLVGGKLNLLGVENGSMRAQVLSTGTNTPMVIRTALHLQAALIDGVIVRIQSPAPATARLYWTHDGAGAGGFSAARSIAFSVPASTTARSIYIDLRAATEWKGKMITSYRIDFPFAAGTTFAIDSIQTSDGDYDRDGIRDTDEGTADIDGDGLANFEDIDSDGDLIADGAGTPLGGGASPVKIGTTETAFLDNATLRMGTPTTQGGSINYLAPTGGANLVNWYDPGRLIQQSYYAGPSLTRTGQSPSWSPWSWNPIQGGDASNKKSQVIEMTQFDFGTGFFTRTVPLLWDMTTGEKAKAWIDQWNQFEPNMPNVIRITCRLACFRDTNDVWTTVQARHQEFPAVYFIRSLSKVVTYKGASPWTNDPVEDVTSSIPPGPPWVRQDVTENWVAMLNPTTNVGVGLYSPIGSDFWWVGAVGTTATGTEKSSNTMHMAPLRTLRLERNSILSYRYWIVYGSVETIRQRIYELRQLYPNG